jgi:hypothetical protein
MYIFFDTNIIENTQLYRKLISIEITQKPLGLLLVVYFATVSISDYKPIESILLLVILRRCR